MATEYYLNNKNLKNVGVPIEWTPARMREYHKCLNDEVYFIKKYCKIVHVDKGLVKFELWPFQEDMIRTFQDNRFTICKMPRQVGKTTTVAAHLLYSILFNPNYQIAILANKEKNARDILTRIKQMYEGLPSWLQHGIKRWNEGDIVLENDSKIFASSTSSSAVRGGTYNLIYLDEFAFVPNNIQETFFASVYPTISSGQTTKVIITSTPNGMNLFYKLWKDAEDKKNRYVTCSVEWHMIPGRTEAWKQETISNTSERQFRQEYGCEFLGSSNTLIDPSTLMRLVYVDPILKSGRVDVYKQPIKDHVYMTVVDTSRGAGIDSSAFIVFDITAIPYTIAAKYKDPDVPVLVYPNIIYNVSKHYNSAYILVETNDVGQQVADILQHDLEYDNMITTKSQGRGGQKVGQSGGTKHSLGVRTTTQVKRIGCMNFKSILENDKLIVEDYDLIYELFRFIEENGKYAAEEGEHDDLVMCCVLFSWMVNQDYFKELADNNAREAVLLSKQKQLDDEMAPFGFIDDIYRVSEEDNMKDEFDRWFDKWLVS